MERPAALLPDAKTRHDLRNQLGVILGYAEMLLADAAQEDPRRADLDEIRQAAVNALDLVERLYAGPPGTP
jgi:signal transduction histidine kinase